MKQLLVVVLLVLFLITPANAQTFRGAINGTGDGSFGGSGAGSAR